jgi:hypothetical protein
LKEFLQLKPFLMKPLFLFVLNCFGAAVLAQTPAKGLIFNDVAYQKMPIKDSLTRNVSINLPSKASLKAFCPTSGHQSSYSNCIGWAASYSARTIVWAKQTNTTSKKEITKQAFSPDFVYKSIKPKDTNCNQGAEILPALAFLQKQGDILKTDLATCPDSIPQKWLLQAAKNKIDGFEKLFELNESNAQKIKALKKSLAEGNPVVIASYLPPSFSALETVLWSPKEPLETYLHQDKYGHALCVVGYDSIKFGGAFEIQNSYGENWGDKGFCWVRYNDLAACTLYAFELIPPITEQIAHTNTLKGDLHFILPNGLEMPVTFQEGMPLSSYRMAHFYKPKTTFRIHLNRSEPSYLYIITAGATQKVDVLFPQYAMMTPIVTYKQGKVVLPHENKAYSTDTIAGTDLF